MLVLVAIDLLCVALCIVLNQYGFHLHSESSPIRDNADLGYKSFVCCGTDELAGVSAAFSVSIEEHGPSCHQR